MVRVVPGVATAALLPPDAHLFACVWRPGRLFNWLVESVNDAMFVTPEVMKKCNKVGAVGLRFFFLYVY